MKNPYPANLQTPDEVRAGGWQAEARDADGHLISCHAPFDTDAGCGQFVREYTAGGMTVTIWPDFSAQDPEVARLLNLLAAFNTIIEDNQAMTKFSRSVQQDLRIQAKRTETLIQKLTDAEGTEC